MNKTGNYWKCIYRLKRVKIEDSSPLNKDFVPKN